MAIIEGFVVDAEKGTAVFNAVIRAFDDKGNEIAVAGTNARGEFSLEVPVGLRYEICAMSQIYDLVCFKVVDDRGDWVPLTEEGRRIRLDTKSVLVGEV